MLRIALVLGWLASMSLVGACWLGWQGAAATALQPGELLLLTVVTAVTPWAAGPALLPWLRRQSSGGVNIPHADHWFTGERRAASLDRLAPFMDAMGLMVCALLSSLLAARIWHGDRGLTTPEAMSLVVSAVFGLATILWVVALLRAFPRPSDDDPAPEHLKGPRRPQRPRASHH